MTTQRQTDQPADLGERVAKVEGGFSELSVRIDTLQRSVDNLRSETQAGDAALRAEIQAGDAALRAEVQAGDAALAQRIEALRTELHQQIDSVRAAISREAGTNRVVNGAIWATILGGFIAIYFKG